MSTKLFGYNGKLAYINLERKSVEIKELDPKIARDYLGGTGLSVKLLYDLLSEEDYKKIKQDPYHGKNPLIFATGPLTGTIRPSSGRFSVSGISPLTGIWGEGTSGGFFCQALKQSGFDALVFQGKAVEPTYVYINESKIQFLDASDLWGKDTYETQEIIKKNLNNNKIKVACIGNAGENLVKYACIINDEGRAQGRCGLGALMGSKNLKAIAIHGTENVSLFDSNSMKELRKKEDLEIESDFVKSASLYLFNLFGTNGYLDLGMKLGDTPAYYFTETEFFAESMTGKSLKEKFPVFNYGCAGCTKQCGKTTIINLRGEEIKVDGPEYESVASLGPLCGNFNDPESVILANHLCNKYGIDTISCGVSIAFLIFLIENKINLNEIRNHCSEMPLDDIKWGNGNAIVKLIELITKRRDIGNILAEGVRKMAKIFNVNPELAAHVKGLEMPMHDPRAFAGQALNYMTCCIGASHEKADWFNAELGTVEFSRLRIKKGSSRFDITKREKGIITLQDIRAIDDSAVNCNFHTPSSFETYLNYINYATGFNYNKKDLLMVGERINNLKRLINCKLGVNREDDKLPQHLTKPLERGTTAGVKLNLENNLKTYYQIRGWDWETGMPTEEKLKQLNIL
ncbi:MAG: aldehyde ferredoxin oxidoreductase family protein [Promethearchaeota archaeon]